MTEVLGVELCFCGKKHVRICAHLSRMVIQNYPSKSYVFLVQKYFYFWNRHSHVLWKDEGMHEDYLGRKWGMGISLQSNTQRFF